MPPPSPKFPLQLRLRAVAVAVVAAAVALLVVACGSSGDPNQLLRQTFGGAHPINSGKLSFSVTVTPSGSSSFSSPITVSFGGPFQSLGQGKLPKSNFNLSISGFGRGGNVALVSTGTTGYVTLQGASYQLPTATFQRLESSFAGVSTPPGSSSGSGGLARLGIDPLHWLTNPKIVGSESIGGTDTTHIRSSVNVKALLADLNTFIARAASTGAAGSSSALRGGLPAATQQRIASEVRSPTFDVWTGKSDKTLRRMSIALSVPVTGQTSTLLGGMSNAAFSLNMQYSDVGQPQTITAPTALRPFSEFQNQLHSFLASIQTAGAAAIGGSASSSGAGAGAGSTGGSGASSSSGGATIAPSAGSGASSSGGSPAAVQAYAACLKAAGQDVSKMQACAPLLQGK